MKNPKTSKKILILRKQMDKIDKRIFYLLKKRFQISIELGKIKKKNDMKIRDIKRENKIIKNKIKSSGLDKKFIKDLYRLIFKESRRLQK